MIAFSETFHFSAASSRTGTKVLEFVRFSARPEQQRGI